MQILSAFKSAFSRLAGLFSSGKAQNIFDSVAELVPLALPIVQAIADVTPNRSDNELVRLFSENAIPWLGSYLTFPQDQRGPALLRAASTMLARQAPGTATHVLDAAVQLAVVATRAKAA